MGGSFLTTVPNSQSQISGDVFNVKKPIMRHSTIVVGRSKDKEGDDSLKMNEDALKVEIEDENSDLPTFGKSDD